MSYPVEDKVSRDKISYKKEFALYTDISNAKETTIIDKWKRQESILELNSYQSFIKNYFNPNTKYTKLYLIHGTGTGKTITSLSAVNEYIKLSKDSTTSEMNNVIIVGFTKNIFKRELLTFPEFNFLTKKEIDELLYVESQVKYGQPDSIRYLNELKIKYSRRLFNRSIGGIFKFYGYKELLMKLLDFSKIIKKGIKLSNVKSSDIRSYLDSGDIKINEPIMKLFSNSLIVCDEIHNAYNSFHINNWGTIMELIVDYYNDPAKKGKSLEYNSVRIMYLSATPISNNPIELVSIINLLNNKEDRITNDMLFDSNGKLLPKKIPLIRSLLYGKISYVMDNNPVEYPSSTFIGENISHIHYLKFIRCPMSTFHKNTYIYLSNEQTKEKTSFDMNASKDTSSEFSESVLITKEMRIYPVNLALHNRYLNDYILPNPKNDKIGIFLGQDLEHIHHAERSWKEKNGIYTEIDMFNQYIFSGPFLLEENLKKYSMKYYKMLQIVYDIIQNKNGKIFIYHHFVNNSGILFIQSILQENGFLLNDSEPLNTSKCIHCIKPLKTHSKKSDHEFSPVRFTVVTGNLSKAQIYKNLDRFNQTSNIQGNDIKIILGSKAIKESYNIKGIQHILVTHSPDNISDLIQVIGRGIRKYSHMELPLEQRHTNIYVLVSSLTELPEKRYPYTFEEARYKSKINIYKVIQYIENIMYDISIDYLINFMVNKREIPKLIGSSFYTNNMEYNLYKKKIYNSPLDMSTFNTYYIEDEISTIKYIIKRLFVEYQPVYSYSDLFAYVKNPPFLININTKLLSESSFIMAIDSLLYKRDNVFKIVKNKKEIQFRDISIIQSLYDTNSTILIGMDGLQYIIINHGEYFMMIQYYLYIDDKLNEIIKLDQMIDSAYRKTNLVHVRNIPITEYVQQDKIKYSFDTSLQELLQSYMSYKDIHSEFINTYPITFHVFLVEKMIEDYILYIMKGNPISNELLELYIFLIPLYTDLKILITFNDITVDTLRSIYVPNIDMKSKITTLSIIKKYKHHKKLPISHSILGHYLLTSPKLYSISEKKWIEYSSIIKRINFKDNIEIIGFDVKQKDSLHIDFKIKLGSSKDTIGEGAKGIVCLFQSKTIIKNICSLLKIKIPMDEKIKKDTLCSLIRSKLIELDKEERKKQTNIKYFYYFYEHVY